MQRECKFCDNHQQVNMEKPEGSEKWIVTNLDGSFHKHVRYGGSQQQEERIYDGSKQTGLIGQNISHENEAKITAALRTEGWNKAHAENMDSNEQTRQTIRELIAELKAIGISINQFNQMVKSYLTRDNEEEERHPELDD